MTLVMDRRRLPRLLRGVVPSLALPGVVTLGALLPIDFSTATAALCYVLAVVVAAAAGGLVAGLVASVCSFLALNFFFTPPLHTFAVEGTADLVALAVFLAVSATVGTMFSRALEQRARAERREREARLLHHLGTRLRSGVPTEDVLRSLARSILELFGLERCEITSELAHGPIVAERQDGQAAAGPEEVDPDHGAGSGARPDRRGDRWHAPRDDLRGAWGDPDAGLADRPRDRRDAARIRSRGGADGGGDEPAARGPVLLRHPRPSDAAGVDHRFGVQPPGGQLAPAGGAAARAAGDDRSGDRAPEPRDRQPDGSLAHAGGGGGAHEDPRRDRRADRERDRSIRSDPRGARHPTHAPRGSSRDPGRRGPDRSGAHEHRGERGAVHAAGQTDHDGGGSVARRRAGADRGSRTRDPPGGAGAGLRALRPRRGERGNGSRTRDRASDRGCPRRHDRIADEPGGGTAVVIELPGGSR